MKWNPVNVKDAKIKTNYIWINWKEKKNGRIQMLSARVLEVLNVENGTEI